MHLTTRFSSKQDHQRPRSTWVSSWFQQIANAARERENKDFNTSDAEVSNIVDTLPRAISPRTLVFCNGNRHEPRAERCGGSHRFVDGVATSSVEKQMLVGHAQWRQSSDDYDAELSTASTSTNKNRSYDIDDVHNDLQNSSTLRVMCTMQGAQVSHKVPPMSSVSHKVPPMSSHEGFKRLKRSKQEQPRPVTKTPSQQEGEVRVELTTSQQIGKFSSNSLRFTATCAEDATWTLRVRQKATPRSDLLVPGALGIGRFPISRSPNSSSRTPSTCCPTVEPTNQRTKQSRESAARDPT